MYKPNSSQLGGAPQQRKILASDSGNSYLHSGLGMEEGWGEERVDLPIVILIHRALLILPMSCHPW